LENDKLSQISFEVDDIIAELSLKYKMDPLTLTSIMLARIVLTNDYVGSGDDFRKLLANVPPGPKLLKDEVMH
jgi:hypothetical protein